MILSQANPFAWDRCDHSGIGQPGCSTCDPDKSRCLQRARYEAYCEVEPLVSALEALKAGVEDHGYELSRRCDLAACNCGNSHPTILGERMRRAQNAIDKARGIR